MDHDFVFDRDELRIDCQGTSPRRAHIIRREVGVKNPLDKFIHGEIYAKDEKGDRYPFEPPKISYAFRYTGSLRDALSDLNLELKILLESFVQNGID